MDNLLQENRISHHRFFLGEVNIQSFHLAMSSSYLNGEDWTKQFISKILQITHSQWIFRNISFHDRKNGYLRNKMVDELLQHINSLSEVSPEEHPKSSRFLLEINFSELSKHHLETQRYWTLAVDVALKANTLEQACQAGLVEAQHQGTKQTKIRDCSCRAPDPSGWDAPSRLL
jgi:hypothetical protein